MTSKPSEPQRPISSLTLPESSALCLAHNDKYIFAGLPSGLIRVWDTNTLKLRGDLVGHARSVLALLYVQEGRNSWLISASADSTVRVWNAATLKPIWKIRPPHDGFGDVLSIAYADRRIVFGCQSCALLWIELPVDPDVLDGSKTPPSRQEERYHKFFDSQPALDLSRAHAAAHGRLYSSLADLSLVSSRSSTSSTSLCDMAKADDKPTENVDCLTVDQEDVYLSAHYGYIYSAVNVSIEGQKYLVTGSGDGSIKLWKWTHHGFDFWTTLLEEQDDGIISLAVRNNTTLYAGLQGGSLQIFDLNTLTLIRTLSTGDADVLGIVLTDDGCLATTADGMLYLFSHSFMLEAAIKAHEGLALTCTAANGGTVVYTGGNDSTLRLWHFEVQQNRLPTRSEAIQGRLFNLLASFVRFRSISASEEYREECRQTALWLKDTLGSLGGNTLLLPSLPGRNPIVLSTFSPRKPSTPTGAPRKRVLFYGHYDVVNSKGDWTTSDPFTLTGIGAHLYGRGVIDNKGPIIAVAVAVADLLERDELDLDVVLLLEGEEEVDSAGFRDAVAKHSDQIGHIDAVLVSNSYSLSEDLPSLMFGLRGRINLTVNITSENPDLHSGMMGGISSEPLIDMTRVLATLIEAKSSKVMVDGFYDQVRKLDRSEEEVYDAIMERCPESLLRNLVQHSCIHDVRAALIKSWREPSLSIHGIEVSGPSISTVIPREARAKVSIRTVPDMSLKTTSAAIVRFLEGRFAELGSEGNSISITTDSNAPWWIADRQHPYSKAAEEAVLQECGVPPLWIREGGSLPSLPFLENHFSACVVHLPMGSQGDHAHLVNERTAIVNLQRGKNSVERWLQALPVVSGAVKNAA